MNLRAYQQEMASNVLESLVTHRRVVASCPTGSGKTVIAMRGIVPNLNGKTAWITHRKELVSQARKYGAGVEIFMAQGAVTGKFQNIIIDEGHHVCARQYRDIITDHPEAIIIALTATPYRLDGVGLGSCGFTKIIHGPDAYELTQAGVLCPVRVYVPKSENNSAWSADSARSIISKTPFKRGIVFCRSIEESKTLAHLLNRSGVRSDSVDGTMDQKNRQKLFDGFESGSINVLCNHTIFTEGVDVPCIDLIVLNRYTESRCLWKQMIGRGTRNSEGKRECVVLDLAGNSVTHGSIYDREIYNLSGCVESTESRTIGNGSGKDFPEYTYSNGEELKEWKQLPKPVSIIESLQRLKSKSPLLRLRTGFIGC